MLVKSVGSVGVDGAFYVSFDIHTIELRYLRTAQFKSATPRTSVAQHTALPSEHRFDCRRASSGMTEARAVEAPVRATITVEKCMVFSDGWL